MAKKQVAIMMVDEDLQEYEYGKYPYETPEEKERVINIMLEVQRERGMYTRIKEL